MAEHRRVPARRDLCGVAARLHLPAQQHQLENPEPNAQLGSGVLAARAGRDRERNVQIFLQTIFGLKRYRLFGRPDDMSNRFNAAAEGKLVLFYDEAVFAHDPDPADG